ncbi:tRNA m(1)G methyltransferase domain containing protein [Talaromyces stipitatus ATCC 10500]|uniref:tRNA (guanine(9)-N1)-methyltransferase n=1 Tax=Talaromyces stipitatus (strain ATCC 10500 / CBS 375.48 / QM 6759 / NRRL 1006) TaxID=441959 RepID=B8MTH9_TALSN|nr:tRNA m(1)G methyltransferase domain containing protein [Talaromyces stipitatus ATCC 10500]EED12386.1 tRNA m(1)G methyltransferase domain containing protein [Talaromyces stipitatus ATCC 10500]
MLEGIEARSVVVGKVEGMICQSGIVAVRLVQADIEVGQYFNPDSLRQIYFEIEEVHNSSDHNTMEEGERPRKLQKRQHNETIESNSTDNGEPMMAGALKAGDEPIVDDQKNPVEATRPTRTAKLIEEQSNEMEDEQEGTTEENTTTQTAPLSKKQQKRLLRQQKWDEQKEERKKRRKEKNTQRKMRKREEWKQVVEENGGQAPPRKHSVLVPVAVVIDCGWDELMADRERISLGSQITRSYSDNSKAPYRTHLAISSFDKLLKVRFDTVLRKMHENWRGVHFMQEDFVHAAEQAKEWMKGPGGGKLEGALANKEDAIPENGEVIYLSSDSPNTLTELKPYSTYIVGGLVDKNRHKGVCYQRAIEKGIKTAKLPIGEYLRMASRPVLATNHVVEIMLRWLELGDWGEAFLKVIPQRKGGILKNPKSNDTEEVGNEEESGMGATDAEMASSEEENGSEAEGDECEKGSAEVSVSYA